MYPEAKKIVDKLRLQPHPEGGYFKEIYRSEGVIPQNALGKKYEGNRNYCTAIYFLLTSDTFSAFHCIHQDEIWHFYAGSPILLHQITPEGIYSCLEIGNDFAKGQMPQVVVKGGVWFGATVKNENSFSLVGCTVSPGFDFRDFELAEQKKLIQAFPQHKAIIARLTRK